MAFWTTILLSASIASIAAIGLFLQIRSGQMNVGMAVFVGIGGYSTGALCLRLGLTPGLSIPIAVVVGAVCGAGFSAMTLRLHHWFFAVTTLTLTVAAVSGVTLMPVFGGPLGLTGVPIVVSPLPIIIGFVLSVATAYCIEQSTAGIAIRATGDDQVLAQVFGVRVKRLRIGVFAVGSAMAALAGALQAHRFGLYQPTDMGFFPSMLLFVFVIVGGKTSVFGPLLGCFFLYTMPEIVKISPQAEMIVYGALMILVSDVMPGGLVHVLTVVTSAVRRRSPLGGPKDVKA